MKCRYCTAWTFTGERPFASLDVCYRCWFQIVERYARTQCVFTGFRVAK